GLEAGQTVVTVGGQLLHPGQVVEVAQPPQPTQSTASRDAVGGGQP
ncbi:TPA: efflux RND transporter periplasmic adaptor subunit, partial [Pseudomonas aeruginosa]